jgi:hypothetical protein
VRGERFGDGEIAAIGLRPEGVHTLSVARHLGGMVGKH